jgi:hypothetical protein
MTSLQNKASMSGAGRISTSPAPQSPRLPLSQSPTSKTRESGIMHEVPTPHEAVDGGTMDGVRTMTDARSLQDREQTIQCGLTVKDAAAMSSNARETKQVNWTQKP